MEDVCVVNLSLLTEGEELYRNKRKNRQDGIHPLRTHAYREKGAEDKKYIQHQGFAGRHRPNY